MKSVIVMMAMAAGVLFLTGCTASSAPVPDQTPDFKLGVHDGCATATGEYTKNSELFRGNNAYHEGWFYGRKTCNPSDTKS
jgi:hypothetical protein